MYSQTKQDIKNLRYSFVVTYVRSNHASFQRFLPIDKGAESFEIRPPTVHSNFTVESKNPLHNNSIQFYFIYQLRALKGQQENCT